MSWVAFGGPLGGSWFSGKMVLVVLQENLETGWVVSVTVINRFPRFPEEAVGFVDIGGVGVVGCIVVN